MYVVYFISTVFYLYSWGWLRLRLLTGSEFGEVCFTNFYSNQMEDDSGAFVVNY